MDAACGRRSQENRTCREQHGKCNVPIAPSWLGGGQRSSALSCPAGKGKRRTEPGCVVGVTGGDRTEERARQTVAASGGPGRARQAYALATSAVFPSNRKNHPRRSSPARRGVVERVSDPKGPLRAGRCRFHLRSLTLFPGPGPAAWGRSSERRSTISSKSSSISIYASKINLDVYRRSPTCLRRHHSFEQEQQAQTRHFLERNGGIRYLPQLRYITYLP